MTTDRCIHRIAHNTARKSCLRVFSRACPPFPPRALAPPLFSSLYTAPASLRASARPLSLRLARLLARLPPLVLLSRCALSVLPPRRSEEKTSGRICMYARIIRAAVPRSLIVHRNRNCVFASHARGFARRPATSVSSLFVADLPTLPICAAPSGGHQSSGHPPARFARSTNRTSVSIASSSRN